MRLFKPFLLVLLLTLPAFGQFGSNATKLRGKNLCNPLTPADGQALEWSAANNCWAVGTVFPGTVTGTTTAYGTTSIDSVTGVFSPAEDRYQRWTLRHWQAKLAAIIQGTSGTTAAIGFIGDSRTSNDTYTGPIRQSLRARFGDRGVGWVPFAATLNGTLPTGVTRTVTGTWVDSDAATTDAGPDISSTTAASNATSPAMTITAIATDFVIHYKKCSGCGIFSYFVDSGSTVATTNVNTANSTTDYGTVTVTGMPAASHIIVVNCSGVCVAPITLYGIDLQRTDQTTGVRVERLGNAGTVMATWLAVPQAQFTAGLTAMNLDAVAIAFGTNEHSGNTPPATYVANVATFVGWLRAMTPTLDIILLSPADDELTGKTYTVKQYSDALRNEAQILGVGFIDIYENFGPAADAQARGLYIDSPGIHPNATGGQQIADVILSYLQDGILIDPALKVATSYFAGYSAANAQPSGASNTGVGAFSLLNLTTGANNTAVGRGSLGAMTTASNSTAVGYNALLLATGTNNTATGFSALGAATSAANVTATGGNACGLTTTGSNSTCLGYDAGYSNLTSQFNTSVGAFADFSSTGADNTALGYGAGYTATAANANTTGHDNTFLGYNSGPSSTTQQTFMTVIGAGATAACSSCIQIGRSSDVTIMRPPTSCTGLATGTLWNNAGALAICP